MHSASADAPMKKITHGGEVETIPVGHELAPQHSYAFGALLGSKHACPRAPGAHTCADIWLNATRNIPIIVDGLDLISGSSDCNNRKWFSRRYTLYDLESTVAFMKSIICNRIKYYFYFCISPGGTVGSLLPLAGTCL